MKKLILLAGATFLTGLPAPAQIDWIGTRVDTRIYERRIENSKNSARRNQQKGTKNRKAKTRKTAPAAKRIPERYPQVQVNGKLLKTAVPATQIDGYTFVPFRDIFEALGATVQYDEKKRLITATRENSRMELLLPDGDTKDLSGRRQSFASKEMPFKRNGVTMVPLRMVSEKMGATVTYTQNKNIALISILSPKT